MGKTDLQFPAGFRFHPTDEELASQYLVRKCESQTIPAPIIAEIDLYKFDPWDLPDRALYGEKEWYFFSPRDRKYPNGSRPNRAAGSGYWKATGADKPIGKPKPIGIKKALVFYAGKAPKGDKTNWIMHEYRLANVDRTSRQKNSLRLDDWVLCRIYNKKGVVEKQSQQSSLYPIDAEEKKPKPLEASEYFALAPDVLQDLDMHFDWSESAPKPQSLKVSGYFTSAPDVLRDRDMHVGSSESTPKPHPDSSCSEHVASPEFNREVQSEPKSCYSWEFYDFPGNYGDTSMDLGGTVSQQDEPFMYLQKPF